MEFTKQDINHAENLIKALKKGTYNFDGMEALAFAELLKWVNRLVIHVQSEVQKQEAKPVPMNIKEVDNKVIESSKHKSKKK